MAIFKIRNKSRSKTLNTVKNHYFMVLVPGAALGVPGERLGPWGLKWGRGTKFLGRIFGRLWDPLGARRVALGSLAPPLGDSFRHRFRIDFQIVFDTPKHLSSER